MKKQSIKKLENMYQDLLDERDEIERKLEDNTNRMKEIDLYLKSIYEKEDSDFKVFSPRNVESIFKETIDSNKAEKKEIEEENKSCYKRLNILNSYLSALGEALPSSEKQDEKEEDVLLEDKITQGLDASSSVSLDERLSILSVQEEERQRIARDLHDSSLQNLTHLVHKIELSGLYIDKDPIRAKLELATVSKSLKNVINEIRNTIYDLRPMSFDDLGFKETVERLCNILKENFGLSVLADIDVVEVTNEIELMTIYRIIHECCVNAVKHSEGNEVAVTFRNLPSMYKIIVRDNGKGFILSDVKGKRDHHYGLTILNERVKLLNGILTIDSVLEVGTTITVEIPRGSV